MRWDSAFELYTRWTNAYSLTNDPNIFELKSFEKIVGAAYRHTADPVQCNCPSGGSGTTVVCPCPSWEVIQTISEMKLDQVIPLANTITVLFDLTHVAWYENMQHTYQMPILNASWLEEIARPKLAASLSTASRLTVNKIHISAVDNAENVSTIQTTTSLSSTSIATRQYNTIGTTTTVINVTLEFDYDHELTVPLQLMMQELSFKTFIISALRETLHLNDQQTLRASSYYSSPSSAAAAAAATSGALQQHVQYPEIHWAVQLGGYPPEPETCVYDTEDFILMMFNEVWCWYRDLPPLVHIIVASSICGFTLLLTSAIMGLNFKNDGRLCCDTCRCCTRLGRRCCGCLPCCPCCRCCRCCFKVLEDQNGEPPKWCDCSRCKNKCQGNDDDDDEDRYNGVMPSITIKGRTKSTKSVRLQMSKIVPVKGRPVGAPAHIIEEMFSFEDVSVFVFCRVSFLLWM